MSISTGSMPVMAGGSWMDEIKPPEGYHWHEIHGTMRLLRKDTGDFRGMVRENVDGFSRVHIPAQDIGPFPSRDAAQMALVAMVEEMQKVKDTLTSFEYLNGDEDDELGASHR